MSSRAPQVPDACSPWRRTGFPCPAPQAIRFLPRLKAPPFQRAFKWEAADIVKLFDSLLRGFPIGNLLLWRRPAPAQRLQVGPLSIAAPESASALWVVDGQQRIVSLVGALTQANQSVDPRFRVHLDLDTGEFHTAGSRQQPPRSWVPVSSLLDTAVLLRWMRDNSGWLTEPQLTLADQAAKAIREYQIPTYVVSSGDESALLEIFTRMNTTGKRLTKSEVFQALHAGAVAEDLTTLHGLGRLSAELGFGTIDDRLALRCILAFRGGDVFREDFRQEFAPGDDPAEVLREVAGALGDAVRFLRGGCGIPHIKLLPYSHVLPTMVRFVRLHGVPEHRCATLLRRWVWRSAVAGTRARGISVADIRNQVAAVDVPDPLDAATELLKRVQPFPEFTPELDKIHFNHAMTKINALGLLSAEPRDPTTGELLDVARMLDHGSPLRPLLSQQGLPLSDTIGNRLVLPPGERTQPRELASASTSVATSHLIDEEGQGLLLRGKWSDFVHHRSAACSRAIATHVDQMAEWGARDGRALADILRSAA
ncbi:GmrSD restriction endonuclease domain-containing protein [Micromonospora inyonensis]|uniref:Uncharacterized conserved protein, contains ParB-like and HNH nuclease domains n=1 Tax=Micromonospora inyonensis TaxID=47866 RepID=A0A1C6SQK0_9ACTN|nr:DUF262 domain-containing protein [Micromonospora inyonensis]SCL31612.1 Uncharacterized conserved protein, contains ParB-like and HNH nuclease domains [Micromonospora inyonensis]